MTGKLARELTLDEAKKGVNDIIMIINEFLDSIEKVIPKQGYGRLADKLRELNIHVQESNGPFLEEKTVYTVIDWLIKTFTGMHQNIEKNLQDLFEAEKEISQFLEQNQNAFQFKLLDFDSNIINKMREVTVYTNEILPRVKQSGYSGMTEINALLLNHSSRVETAVKAFLEELIEYREKINQYARSNQIQHTAKFDPVKIMGIRGVVQRRDQKFYTEATAIRHLIDHHHFTIHQNPCMIHFKSPSLIEDPTWKFDYDKMFTCEDFYNFVAEIDTFCKSAVSLLFTFQLLGILRMKFMV